MFTSLRYRILMLVFLAVLPPLGLVLYIAAEDHKMAARQVEDEALHLAQLASRDCEQLINNTHQFLAILAELPEVRNVEYVSCTALFRQLIEENPGYINLTLASPSGDILCSADPAVGQINLAEQTYFQRILITNDFVVGEYQVGRSTGKPYLNFGHPVFDHNGRVQAVLIASLGLSWLNQMAAGIVMPPGTTMTLRDRDGTILARYPDEKTWVGWSVQDVPLTNKTIAGEVQGTVISTGIDGVSRLYAFGPLSEAPGGSDVLISVGIPTDVAFAGVNRQLARNLAGLGLATALVLAIAWIGSNHFLLHQVNTLLAATRRLAGGEPGARSGPPYGPGEMGQLARAFDEMAAALEQQGADLRQAEARYRALVENTPAVTYTMNPADGNIIYLSRQIEPLLGIPPAEWLANPGLILKYIHPADRQHVHTEQERCRVSLDPFRSEHRMITRDGREIWVHHNTVAVRDESGQPRFMQGFIFDISDRKRAEEAAKEAYSELHQIFNAAADGMCVIEKNFNILHANDAFTQLLGLGKDEVVGKKCYEVFPDIRCHTPDCPLLRVLGGELRIDYDLEKTKAGGSIIHCIATATPYRTPGGDLTGVVKNIKDISERKKVEKEMAQLERLNLVGEMAAGIGHEIRNPMTTVRGLLQLLGAKQDFLKYKSHFDLMIDELDRANSIITEFLSLTQSREVELQEQNLNTIIETLFPLIQADVMAAEKYINLELSDIPDLPLNEKEIRQLILNLMRNGLEAMTSGGQLTIKTFFTGTEVVLAVQDQGPGIEPGLIEKLGIPFFTTKDNGTGLGLPVCHNIAARHSAAIEIETGPGGTTFLVRFRLSQPN